ncbi:MAG: hypothetical protein S0880_20005 [Actinomycetota bacterium]|nr:hypothetical protein [Actinomycetota bacterium]
MQPLRDRLLRYRVTLVPHSSGDRVDWLPPLDTPGVHRFPAPAADSAHDGIHTGIDELLADLAVIDAWGLDLGDYGAPVDPDGSDGTGAADGPLADVVDLAAARARRSADHAAADGG